MGREYKRTQLYIGDTFQKKFVIKFCLIVIASAMLIGALIFYFTQNSTTVAIENTKVVVKPTSDFILPVLSGTVLIVSFFSAIVILAVALYVSHRIAGPLYRIEKEIALIKGGDLTRHFSIRQKDQLQTLARHLDEMTQALEERHVEIKNKLNFISNFLDEKNFHVKGEDSRKLRKMLEEINEDLKFFKVQ